MKILVLSYEYPPIGGGGGVICKNISENLALLGNDVTVITTEVPQSHDEGIPCTPAPDSCRDRHAGAPAPQKPLTLIRLKARRKKAYESNPMEMLSWINITKRYIRETPGFPDFDLCMAHFVLPGGEVARWLKKKYSLPYVLVSHGHDIPWVHPRQMFVFHLATYFWIKTVCRQSTINFIQTRMMKSNIDRFLGMKYEAKNVIVPNGVDTAHFYPDYTKRPVKLRILFVGRLVEQKDPMTFMEAIRLFSGETRDFEVHVLGDGKLRKKMEQFTMENDLSPNVKFYGKVSEQTMLDEYQGAHLMVAPSLSEGMSIAALEALSCGVYLITTRASGFEDMIEENVNGEFVGYRDEVDIYKKLSGYFSLNLAKLSDNQTDTKKTSDAFSWAGISRDYFSLIALRLIK